MSNFNCRRVGVRRLRRTVASWARRYRRLAVALALPGGALFAQPAAQAGVLIVRVRSQVDGSPLVNAELIATPGGERALTRENGVARLRIRNDGLLGIRVRQLGYAYQDLAVSGGQLLVAADTVDVRLARVALRLPSVTTRASLACPALPGSNSALAFGALAQLREGAERYETFRTTYRFRVEIERRTSSFYPGDKRAREDLRIDRSDGENWGARYRPHDVVRRGPLGGFSTPILFVNAFGDAPFWEHHCVTAAQHTRDSTLGPVVRLSFEPTTEVGWSDWRGVATLDSATWVLRRLDFSLDVRQRDGPRRLEGFTTFEEVSPLVAVPDSTGAMWWYAKPRPNKPWGEPQIVQLLRRRALTYRDSLPPGAEPPPDAMLDDSPG